MIWNTGHFRNELIVYSKKKREFTDKKLQSSFPQGSFHLFLSSAKYTLQKLTSNTLKYLRVEFQKLLLGLISMSYLQQCSGTTAYDALNF